MAERSRMWIADKMKDLLRKTHRRDPCYGDLRSSEDRALCIILKDEMISLGINTGKWAVIAPLMRFTAHSKFT